MWVKVGGDHGGDSFKLCLQVLNVTAPNAPHHTSMILVCQCRDSKENLARLLTLYKAQIDALTRMRWEGKKVRVFVFGDYEFESKLFGLSGAQGAHPCLWCKTTKAGMKQSQSAERPPPDQRTLSGLREDNKRFREAGADRSKAKLFMNAVDPPIWDIELTQVAPPYLHILLGIVKKHIVAMEKECHELDRTSQKAEK